MIVTGARSPFGQGSRSTLVRMDRANELRIPTITVAVQIAYGSHELVLEQVELFVPDEPRQGRSQLLDAVAELLEAPAPFIPIRGSDKTRLVAKAAIAWVAMRRRRRDERPSADFAEEPSEVFTLYDRQHRVEIQMAQGTQLEGLLLDSSPADRPRVIDHLNHTVQFVRLWTSEEHLLINKAQIVRVTELPEVE